MKSNETAVKVCEMKKRTTWTVDNYCKVKTQGQKMIPNNPKLILTAHGTGTHLFAISA
jgi:hypothetical protein